MKLLRLFSILAIFWLMACEKENRFQLADKELTLSKDTIVFTSGNEGTLFLQVNVGQLLFKIDAVPSWLLISQTQGNINIVGTTLQFAVNQQSLPLTAKVADLTIQTSLVTKKITVIYLPEQNGIPTVTDEITIKNSLVSSIITIVNNANKTISWTSSGLASVFSINKTSGTLKVGESTAILITVNRALINSSGIFESSLSFNVDGKPYNTKIFVENFEDAIVLDRDVVDAEFDKINGHIYFISTSPKALNRYNLANGNLVSIELNFSPACLDLRPDNKKAIIGHDQEITEIDLSNMSISSSYNIGIKILDVQLSQNDVVYIFSDHDQWGNLRWINLNNGNEFINTQNLITYGMVGNLHPNQKWLYAARKIGTDGTLERFNIDGVTTEFSHTYRSNNFEFALLENVWFTETGNKMLSGNQLLFCDEDPKKDMVIAGKLAFPKVGTWDTKILSAAHSETERKFYISLYTNWPVVEYNSRLFVYDSQTLGLVNSFDVVDFTQNGFSYKPQLRYVFQYQNKIVLVMKGHEHDVWAINQLQK